MMSKFENEATDHCVLNAKSKIRLKINFKKRRRRNQTVVTGYRDRSFQGQ